MAAALSSGCRRSLQLPSWLGKSAHLIGPPEGVARVQRILCTDIHTPETFVADLADQFEAGVQALAFGFAAGQARSECGQLARQGVISSACRGLASRIVWSGGVPLYTVYLGALGGTALTVSCESTLNQRWVSPTCRSDPRHIPVLTC